jgi:hypothetical protein
MMDIPARLLHVSLGRVNVKARTHENVDSVSAIHPTATAYPLQPPRRVAGVAKGGVG